VDFPIPFGPTMASRLSKSRPKLRSWNRVGPPECKEDAQGDTRVRRMLKVTRAALFLADSE
jgi:hypothetical protein